MSTTLELADAVVASLNATGFSLPFTAERKYQPVFELADLETVQVGVVPKSLGITTAARNTGYYDVAVDIGVQKKVTVEDDAELDGLMVLVEEIADHLRMKRLDTAPDAAWLSIANEPVFAPEHLEQWRQFTSILTVTYRVRR